jgi:hypothetical protein
MAAVGGRDRTPGLQWHKEYNEESKLKSRVLMIDYLKKGTMPASPTSLLRLTGIDVSDEGTRRVVAREIHELRVLRDVYRDGRGTDSILRVLYVYLILWTRALEAHLG